MKTLLSAVVAATLAVAAIDADAGGTPEERQVSLVIESKTLAEALDQWAQQTGFQIFVPNWELAKRISAPRLQGKYGARDALDRLLKGTPLMGVWTTEKAVTIREKGTPIVWQGEPRQPPTVQKFVADGLDGRGVLGTSGDSAGDVSPPALVMASDSSRKEALEEVVVTGTLIRGAQAISPVTVINRDDIERTGFTTLTQVLQSVPQNYGGGDNESTQTSPGGSAGNVGFGSAINLRGLGSGSTLVLVNGHRLAPAGYGQFVDISMVPLSAVKRVEILSDGASATYGSDAVGGVVNVILRDDYEGAETRLTGGSVARGDMSEYQASQALGGSWDSGNVLVNYEFSHRGNLDANERSYSAGVHDPYDLLPQQEAHRVFGTLSSELSEAINVTTTVLASKRDSEFAAVFADEVSTTDATTKQVSGAITATVALGERWLGDVTGVYSRNKTRSVDTTATSTREFLDEHDLASLESRFDGPMLHLPGGDVRLAVGASYRREGYVDKSTDDPRVTRDVTAAFAELSIPLVGEAMSWPGMRQLELSLAGRYEDYSDFGDTSDPKVGVMWSPAAGLHVRGTYGQSFKAPIFFDLDDSFATAILFDLPDPNAADGATLSMWLSGNNRDLKPETATTWTAGVDWESSAVRGLSTSLTYFDIDYKDRIVTPLPGLELFGVFAQEDVYAPLISRNPDPATVVALQTALPGGFLNFYGPFEPGDVEAVVDTRRQNLSIERVRGVDFEASYAIERSNGVWLLHLASTYLLDFADYITSRAAKNDVLNTAYHPVDLRLRASTTWTNGPWGATATINYTDGYENRTVVPAEPVSSWATADLQVAYRTSSTSGWLGGMRVALTTLNMFDKKPPAMSSPIATFDIGFDPTNANALGRFFSLAVTKNW
jgi:iron complex outermembrane recepter protein